MARNFTKSWADRLQDDEFCSEHGILEKLLYLVLNKHDECDNAGLGRLTVRRWVRVVAPATEAEVWAALAGLERTGDVYVDELTEEFLVRDFMFDDEVGRKPNIMINAARSASQVRSPKLAAVLLGELARVDVHRPADPKMAARLDAALVAAEEHLRDRAARRLAPAPQPFAEPFAGRVPETLPAEAETAAHAADPEPFPEPCVAVAVAVASPSSVQQIDKTDHYTQPSYVPPPREPAAQAPAPDPDRGPGRPPPHIPGPECESTPCGACADTSAAALAEQTTDQAPCGLCDHHRHRREPPELAHLHLPVIRCDHTPMSLDEWRRHIPAPVPDIPARPTTTQRKNSRKRAKTHGAQDFSGHRNHRPALAS